MGPQGVHKVGTNAGHARSLGPYARSEPLGGVGVAGTGLDIYGVVGSRTVANGIHIKALVICGLLVSLHFASGTGAGRKHENALCLTS